ncbi:MAG: bifunctional diguanylate cyclase/phosphodiesterase [Actinoplanes sp.]
MRQTTDPQPVTSLLRSRALQASALLTLVAIVWFAAAFGSDTPQPLLWLVTPTFAVLLTAIYWRTSRTPWLVPAARRFWLHLAIVVALVGVATVVQAIDVVRFPNVPGEHNVPLMLAIDGVAVAVIMYALHRLPLARRTGTERVRVTLDAATVMLAAAVFTWHFQTRTALRTATVSQLVSEAFLVVLVQLAVFAVMKVVLSSHVYIDKMALRVLALSMLVGSFSSPLAATIAEHSPLYVSQVSIPLVFLCAAVAAERQRLAPPPMPELATARRRPFSVLPYAAVAGVDTLLVVTLWTGGPGELAVGVAAVLITALVVARQLAAFRDNGRLLDRLDHSATHDALTQLPNRVLFHQRLREALDASGEDAVTVILVDLDDFKTVNDTMGHTAGDTLLVAVAERLRGTVPAGDTVARLGGDEFALLVRDGTAAERVVRDAIQRLRAGVLLEGRLRPVRASFGVVRGIADDDPGDLLRRADIAMYEAKARGDGGWARHTPGMRARGAALEDASAELRRALDRRELRLHYQPVVDLVGGSVIGAEALIRWAHPARGLIGPASIIPAAESTGMIIEVGAWVVDEACRQLAEWRDDGFAATMRGMNVNASARQLREPGFAQVIAAALRRHGLDPDRLTLEITESTAVGGGATADTLADLRRLGVRIALDDFGTGQSTLTLLATCPVDQIKLDRSFVPGAGTVPPPAGSLDNPGQYGSSVIATAVLQLAHGFGVEAVAEGVETEEQARRLRNLGYDRAQGYHFAAPLPAAAFARMLVADREVAL